MDRYIIAFLTVLLIIPAAAAEGYFSPTPRLALQVTETTPNPVEPGQDFTVKVRIINEGGIEAQDVSVTLDTPAAFVLKTSSNRSAGQRLCAGCSLETTYYLTANPDAASGTYPLSFAISENGVVSRSKETIDIRVTGLPDITLAAGEQDSLISGERQDMVFTLRNVGSGTARTVKIIPGSNDIIMVGSNLDFIPQLLPGEATDHRMSFIVRQSLPPDTYTFPVNITYADELGGIHSQQYRVGVNVVHKADVSLQSLRITPPLPVLGDEIHINGIIENTGSGNAENVIATLTMESSEQAFMGRIEADDDAPFFFTVKPGAGEHEYNLTITYDDDIGEHAISTPVTVRVGRPKQKAITIGLSLVVIAALGGGWMLRRRKR